MPKIEEHNYVCNVCKEKYTGFSRKWTCPICGNPDTYDCVDLYKNDSYHDYEDDDDEY